MSVLKRGNVKDIFHNAGVKRVSGTAISLLDAAVERLVIDIADNCKVAYPDTLIESIYIVRISDARDGWSLILDEAMIPDIILQQLMKDVPLPDDLDEEPQEE